MPEISIIIPIYNVEKYIYRCIKSTLSQIYTDFELILVDDGSLDKSGLICDEFAKKDKRIRVLHKENGGVSSARNLGIEKAKGKWIAFIDGDDWVDKNYLLSMINDNHDADLSMQGYKVVNQAGQVKIHRFDTTCFTEKVFEVFCESENKNIINSPISKLFKARIIKDNNILFNSTISYGEDHIFVLEYFKYVKSIYLSGNAEYNYYKDDRSSLSRKPVAPELLILYMSLLYDKLMAIISNVETGCEKAIDIVSVKLYNVYAKLLYDFFTTSPSKIQYKQIINELKLYRMVKNKLDFKRRWLFRFIENVPSCISYEFMKIIVAEKSS